MKPKFKQCSWCNKLFKIKEGQGRPPTTCSTQCDLKRRKALLNAGLRKVI
jgi:hypothetical protein